MRGEQNNVVECHVEQHTPRVGVIMRTTRSTKEKGEECYEGEECHTYFREHVKTFNPGQTPPPPPQTLTDKVGQSPPPPSQTLTGKVVCPQKSERFLRFWITVTGLQTVLRRVPSTKQQQFWTCSVH